MEEERRTEREREGEIDRRREGRRWVEMRIERYGGRGVGERKGEE